MTYCSVFLKDSFKLLFLPSEVEITQWIPTWVACVMRWQRLLLSSQKKMLSSYSYTRMCAFLFLVSHIFVSRTSSALNNEKATESSQYDVSFNTSAEDSRKDKNSSLFMRTMKRNDAGFIGNFLCVFSCPGQCNKRLRQCKLRSYVFSFVGKCLYPRGCKCNWWWSFSK